MDQIDSSSKTEIPVVQTAAYSKPSWSSMSLLSVNLADLMSEIISSENVE